MTSPIPVISIIMPVLNRGDMIETAILSVIKQDYPQTELIILDGGSTDNTVDIIKKYEQHITYWHSQHDGSAPLATNIGITKATGNLVGLLMSDDYYEPGLFHRMAEAWLVHPEADIYTCAGKLVKLDEKTQTVQTLEKYDSLKQLNLNFYNICYGATGICFRFIKKSLHDRIGLYIPFDANNKQMLTNDKEFLLRAVMNQVKEIFVDYPGYTHLAHEGSLSFGNHRQTFVQHCTEHMAIAEDYLAKYPMTFRQNYFSNIGIAINRQKLFCFICLGKISDGFGSGHERLCKTTIPMAGGFCVTSASAVVKRGNAVK